MWLNAAKTGVTLSVSLAYGCQCHEVVIVTEPKVGVLYYVLWRHTPLPDPLKVAACDSTSHLKVAEFQELTEVIIYSRVALSGILKY